MWARDGGRCAFVAPGGRRCTERTFLEFHHVVPYGAGGAATVENIQLRCRAHNGFEAKVFFGRRNSRPHRKGARPHDGDGLNDSGLDVMSSTGSGPS
ncbi:MAG: HNH endonuclease [bacterium]